MIEQTGAVAAAATTSLPERVGGTKNWDYRFSWIRDTTLTMNAMRRCGLEEEVHAGLTWLLDVVRRHGPGIHVMYTLDGALPSSERKKLSALVGPSPGGVHRSHDHDTE